VREHLITIRHPELDVESQVMDESVQTWVDLGWEVVGPTFPQAREDYVDVAGEDLQNVFDFSEDDEPSEASEKE